jgi:FecR protein
MKSLTKGLRSTITLLAAASLLGTALVQRVVAQDQYDQDDPPSRVARLGFLQGSVSFQPAGESEWVEAAQNRPMTTGDQLWADQDSRAELSLGSAVIDLNSNTGISILNLDDRTTQIQLSSGSINVRVRHLNPDDAFEIDTPNQAFSIFQPGRYRVEASEDGSYTVVSIRQGEGESTGNGETYTLHAGQRATFDGTDALNAQVEDLGGPDDFDNWSDGRYQRYENSRSARYVSPDVVGYEDLDENGDWRPDSSYGNVWFPHVSEGWAPYREGHWAWVDPWGWTWVDDEPWGYAPFHYGRWMSVEGRWGWVPGPMEVAPVYAPALVVFVGGGGGFGGNMGWFPLGPREVYVPSYAVSRGYVNRVNVSNTTVSTMTVTNIYNTTIVNKTTVINNVTYANRSVSGAVTAVPQQAFASGQPVARAAVAVNAREIASAPVNARAAVAPTANSVFGSHASTANHVKAPPAPVASRAIVAKAKVPPPPVPFAARQQALAAHPGEPIGRQEMQHLQPTNNSAAARPQVKQAPPGKPATATAAKPGTQPGRPQGNQPLNRPAPPPATAPAANERPGTNPAPPNRLAPSNPPAPNNRPEPTPNNGKETNRPNPPAPNNRPAEPPARTDRPPQAQPNNRPAPNQPAPGRPEPSRPETNRPAEPPAQHNAPAARPSTPPPSARPPQNTPPPAQARPAKPAPRAQTPEEKKKQEEEPKKPQ